MMNQIFISDNTKLIFTNENIQSLVESSKFNELLFKSFILLRNKLYINYLKTKCNYNDISLFIPVNFDRVIKSQIEKNISKLQQDQAKIIQDIITLIESIDSQKQYIIDAPAIENYLLTINNKEISNFILPLAYFFYKNNYTYTSSVSLPELSYSDSICYVTFKTFDNIKFDLKRDSMFYNFIDYLISFKPNIQPVTIDDYNELSFEIIGLLSTFSYPVMSMLANNQDYLIFNLFNIKNNDYLYIISDYVNINPNIRLLLVLYYNNNLANIYDPNVIQNLLQNNSKNKNNELFEILVRIITLIGNLDSSNIQQLTKNILVRLNNINTVEVNSVTGLGIENIITNNNVLKDLLTNINISLEADDETENIDEDEEVTGTDTTGDDSDIPSSDEDTSDDNPDEGESPDDDTGDDEPTPDEGDDESNNVKIQIKSKFGLNVDTEEPTLDTILEKIMYYRKLNQLLNNENIELSDATRMLIHYWLRYWIFIVDLKTTKKFIKQINKELDND